MTLSWSNDAQSRSHALAVLRQFVQGEISTTELFQFVRRRDFYGLDELLEAIEFQGDDLAAIALRPDDLLRRLDQFLGGDVHLREFADWVYQLHQIYGLGDGGAVERSRAVELSLMLLALIVDLEVTESPRSTKHLADILRNALRRRRVIPTELLLRKLFANKRSIYFATRRLGAAPDRPWRENQWAEVVLQTQPLPQVADENGHTGADEPSVDETGWFIPLVICTREHWLESFPDEPWCHRENDRVLTLKERFPRAFAVGSSLQSYAPGYYFDPEGLAEVVLETDEIGLPELVAGTRLFCLANEVRSCYLDGNHVYPDEEDQ